MGQGFFWRDSPGLNQSLHECVVGGYLRDLVFTNHVDARVADVRDGHEVAGEDDA